MRQNNNEQAIALLRKAVPVPGDPRGMQLGFRSYVPN